MANSEPETRNSITFSPGASATRTFGTLFDLLKTVPLDSNGLQRKSWDSVPIILHAGLTSLSHPFFRHPFAKHPFAFGDKLGTRNPKCEPRGSLRKVTEAYPVAILRDPFTAHPTREIQFHPSVHPRQTKRYISAQKSMSRENVPLSINDFGNATNRSCTVFDPSPVGSSPAHT